MKQKALPNKFDKSGVFKEAKEKRRLRINQTDNAVADIGRNDSWQGKCSRLSRGIDKAETIIKTDHYGLVKVKEPHSGISGCTTAGEKTNDTIVWLVGSLGVGKPSLMDRSIARATNRKFMSTPLQWRS